MKRTAAALAVMALAAAGGACDPADWLGAAGGGGGSGQPGEPALEPATCAAPAGLAATYRFDDTADRGRVEVTWQPVDAPLRLLAWRDGALVEDAALPAGAAAHLTAWRVQGSASTAGEIEVDLRLERPCGDGTTAFAEAGLAFPDPLTLCPTATAATLADDPALYYACAELWAAQGAGCGPDGYLLGYGKRYADLSWYELRPKVSAAGKAWVDATIPCLQAALRDVATVGDTCPELRQLAYDTHPACYVAGGLCTLPLKDILAIVGTIDADDLLSPDILPQALGVVLGCGGIYAELVLAWLGG